jgi:uncharacterized protein
MGEAGEASGGEASGAAKASILFWRRLDVAGLERLVLTMTPDGVTADSTVVCVEDGGFELRHRWWLAPGWRTQRLAVERRGTGQTRRIRIERAGAGWLVDGVSRPDLDGAEEPDLSVTPFCNTFPIRRMQAEARAEHTLDTCYVDATAMTVERSRQQYVRLGQNRVRYVDLGVSAGFEAVIDVDDDGLVLRYEHLFERVRPGARP